MAILKIQRISIYALKRDRKPLLELIQRRGVLEISDTIPKDQVFQKMNEDIARSGFEKNISIANEALEILDHYIPKKKSMFSSLNGRKEISIEEYDSFNNKYDQVVHAAYQIITFSKEISETRAEIFKLEAQVDMLTPWMKLDIPLSFSGTAHTKSFIGTLPKEWTIDAIYEELVDFFPLNVDLISSTKDQTCIFVLCLEDKADNVFNKLRLIDFMLPNISSEISPADQKTELDRRILESRNAVNETISSIIKLEKFREEIMLLQDYDRMRSDKYEVIGQIMQSNHTFIVTGYIPEREVKSLEEALNKKFTAVIEVEKPSEEEDVPVLLKNNGFSQPLESVVSGFSLPGLGEIDPTMIMALFYYLFYGIMLADVGYGALMTGACAYFLIKYRKTMEGSMKNFLAMFLYCGISTTFWGVVFGSYFGDLFDVVATTFLGITKVPIIPPLWFFPVNKPMQMLAFSMVLGIVHLITGLCVKIYQLYRQRDYVAILYDAVSWLILIVSSTILLLSLNMITGILGLTLVIPPAVTNLAKILLIISAILIVLTNGRESRNPLKRLLKGAYALYGITGYLSDVLSYSRLLALGLASSIIGNVINKMASMPAKTPVGPLIFIIIVIAGHTLNIAINALGAYVHTNRLQYVEFFGKFYGGGGRPFHPFTMKTKYYKVKENMKVE